MSRDKGGRPTLYSEEMLQRVEEHYKDIREDIINIYNENKKLEHRIIILEQRWEQ